MWKADLLLLLIRGKQAKLLFINENDKERKTLCCSMMSKIKKKVVLQCLNMKGNKLKKSKSCVCETKQIRQIDRPSKVSKCT